MNKYYSGLVLPFSMLVVLVVGFDQVRVSVSHGVVSVAMVKL